jgi:hypothetical protein
VNKPTDLQLMHWTTVIELGGGIFRGVQEGDSSIGLERLILFDDGSVPKKERSTMAIRPKLLSADRVRTACRIKREAYEREYNEYAEKAAQFVFRQFATKEPNGGIRVGGKYIFPKEEVQS